MRQLRAVIYNRCSTEEESQRDALKKQVKEAERCVDGQGWLLVDAYVEAKSGTTARGRSEYNRLCVDLETDKFDVIVIKSQDRLMRNTKDWYLFLERLQRNQKRLYMYLEQKFYTPDEALITGIKAILAEEYSRELSKKMNNAHKNRQREGESFIITNKTYGYRKLPDKRIVVDEGEAEMIRLLFTLSANGYGTHSSAEILSRMGYRNRKGERISPAVLRRIIRNPLYKGDVVQNRQHYDFESKQLKNNPAETWVIHENAVPAIVDGELFIQANRCMDARKSGREGKSGRAGHGRYELSGRLICGLCGSPFYRTHRPCGGGSVVEWKCSRYLQSGRSSAELQRKHLRKVSAGQPCGCDNVHLNESRLFAALHEYCIVPDKSGDRKAALLQEFLPILEQALPGKELEEKQLITELQRLAGRKERLLEKLLDGVIPDEDYRIKRGELQCREKELKGVLEQKERTGCEGDDGERRLAEIREALDQSIFARAQILMLLGGIEKILVFPDSLEITFVDRTATREERPSLRLPQKCATSHRLGSCAF